MERYATIVFDTVDLFNASSIHILQYEALKTSMPETLTRLAKFLNMNVTKRDIDCTVHLQEGRHHRNSTASQHPTQLHTYFSTVQLKSLEILKQFVEKALKAKFHREFNI